MKESVSATLSEKYVLKSTLVIAKLPSEVFDVMMYNRLPSKTLKDNWVLDLIFTVLPSFLSCVRGTRKITCLLQTMSLQGVSQFIPCGIVE